jgi:hypothetical protein
MASAPHSVHELARIYGAVAGAGMAGDQLIKYFLKKIETRSYYESIRNTKED